MQQTNKTSIVLTALMTVLLVGILSGLLRIKTAEAQNRTRVVWDYKAIWIGKGNDGALTWFEDVDTEIPKPVNFIQRARMLGAQGWELTTAAAWPGSEEYKNVMGGIVGYKTTTAAHYYVFKRPR